MGVSGVYFGGTQTTECYRTCEILWHVRDGNFCENRVTQKRDCG
jgi:hypothetical protein